MNMNLKLIAGDSLSVPAGTEKYPAADGWVRRAVASKDVTQFFAISGDDKFVITPSESEAMAVGIHAVAIMVTSDTERHTLSQFTLEILPDPAKAITSPIDNRTPARRILEAIEAALEKRATSAQEEIQINTRRIKNTSVADLLLLRSKYQAIVDNEERGNGGFGQKIYTRWGR